MKESYPPLRWKDPEELSEGRRRSKTWDVECGTWNKRCRHVARSPVKQGSVHNEIPAHKLICVTGIPFEPFRLFLFSDPIGCFSSERSERLVKTPCPLCLCERLFLTRFAQGTRRKTVGCGPFLCERSTLSPPPR